MSFVSLYCEIKNIALLADNQDKGTLQVVNETSGSLDYSVSIGQSGIQEPALTCNWTIDYLRQRLFVSSIANNVLSVRPLSDLFERSKSA